MDFARAIEKLACVSWIPACAGMTAKMDEVKVTKKL